MIKVVYLPREKYVFLKEKSERTKVSKSKE